MNLVIFIGHHKVGSTSLQVFSDAEFVIRNYSDVLAGGGSIPDFINHSGLAFPENLTVEKNANPSSPLCYSGLFEQSNRGFIYKNFKPIHDFLSKTTGETAFFPDQEKVFLTRDIPETTANIDTIRSLLPLLNSSVMDKEILDFVNDFEKGINWGAGK